MTLAQRNNSIEHVIGPGGLPLLRLYHSSGYSVTIAEYGAHVLSWSAPDDRELLFLSKAAMFQKGKAIRGGIPIVFPQFGKGSLPPHGFARIRPWKVVREQVSENEAVSVTLRLVSDTEVERMWPYSFVLEVDVVLTDVLLMAMRVENTGAQPFQFSSAFHTYLRVSDLTRVGIRGLQSLSYLDSLKERQTFVEDRSEVTITGAIDRVYVSSPETVSLHSPADGIRFLITKDGLADTVVWNPWVERAAEIPDLQAQEYREMVCVESGNVAAPVSVVPGGIHSSGQILRSQPM